MCQFLDIVGLIAVLGCLVPAVWWLHRFCVKQPLTRGKTTEEMVTAAAGSLGIEISVEKITDYEAIAKFGIVSTPGIVIDGKVVHAGGLPASGDLQRWLQT